MAIRSRRGSSGPSGAPRGAVVVLQEIFGLNSHIRSVADRFAADGYLAIAPALFDRVRRDRRARLHARRRRGRAAARCGRLTQDKVLARRPRVDQRREACRPRRRRGLLLGRHARAYLAACDLPVAAAVAYYGTAIANHLDRQPKAPVMYHFGERDKTHAARGDRAIRAARRRGRVPRLHADHGFNCEQRAAFDAASAALARERTLQFLAEHVG